MSPYRTISSPFGPLLQRQLDGASIPADPANKDYQAYLAWAEAGGSPDPMPAGPSQVVTSVRPVALRRALRQTPDPSGQHRNALEYVLAALELPSLADAKDAFDYAVEMERGDLLPLCSLLGLTTAQVDAVMTLAATYPGAVPTYGPAP